MNWLTDVLGDAAPVAFGALITGLFLVLQQRRADQREDKRRKEERAEREREREHERAMAEDSRKHELSSSWRAERRVAHAEMLIALDRCWDELESLVDEYNEQHAQNEITPNSELGHGLIDRVDEAMALLRLIGSEDAVRHASDASMSLSDVWRHIVLGRPDGDQLDDAVLSYHGNRKMYVKAARTELGTRA